VSLRAGVRVEYGSFTLDVDLAVAAGEVVAVLGPNGAGKSTLLGALAGLVPLAAGRVELDGRVLDDRAAGVFVPPEQRRIGVVFQDYLLFPHLSALDNVAFGLRSRGRSRAAARAAATAWLARIGLAEQAAARPAQLSGGQAQRVALARALAVEPALLLLDEPLAALDVRTRAETRRVLRARLAEFTGVKLLVTHDPLEAIALGERLVVIEDGRIVQAGTPAEVTARPRSPWVADLVGVNLFRGEAAGDHVALAGGASLVVPGAGRGAVFAVVHPRAVALHRVRPEGTPRNVWAARVDSLDDEGTRVRVRTTGPLTMVAEVTPAAVAALALDQGSEVWVSVKATEISTYPA
jgi:molybdate transport system ATP-binding protein